MPHFPRNPDEQIHLLGGAYPRVSVHLDSLNAVAHAIREQHNREEQEPCERKPEELPANAPKWSDREANRRLCDLGDIEERTGARVSDRTLRVLWACVDARDARAFELAHAAAVTELAPVAPGYTEADKRRKVEERLAEAERHLQKAGGVK